MFNEPQYLPDDWLLELGKITQGWSNFEQLFNLMLAKLAGYNAPFDPIFTILVAHSSFPQRLDMFASLCVERMDEHPHLAAYKDVLSKVRVAQSERNKYSHSIVGVHGCESGFGKLGTMSARGKLKQELKDISLHDLRMTSRKILDAGQSLVTLTLGLEAE